MQCALTPTKAESKQIPGSSQGHGRCFTSFSKVKIVSFCHNFQEMHPASHVKAQDFAQLLVYTTGSGINLIKLGHAQHEKVRGIKI